MVEVVLLLGDEGDEVVENDTFSEYLNVKKSMRSGIAATLACVSQQRLLARDATVRQASVSHATKGRLF
jgi:hypothetical protein